jgi:hypothetical protein
MMIAALALVASAALASAQSLSADVPFALQVGGKALPAGTYRVEKINHAVYAIRGADSVLTPMAVPSEPWREWEAAGTPKLAFRCGSTCVLTDLWQGHGPAYSFPAPKSVEMGTRIAEVTMWPAGKAD